MRKAPQYPLPIMPMFRARELRMKSEKIFLILIIKMKRPICMESICLILDFITKLTKCGRIVAPRRTYKRIWSHLKALIQLAGARLKKIMGQEEAAHRLRNRAQEILKSRDLKHYQFSLLKLDKQDVD